MLDIKEKLVELLDRGPAEYAVGSKGIADHLIANGVTILESNLKVLESATDTNVGHTKADRIRAMSDEELAQWLADMWDCHDCSEHERLGDYPLLSDEPCDQKCKEHCLEWLQQPAEEVP